MVVMLDEDESRRNTTQRTKRSVVLTMQKQERSTNGKDEVLNMRRPSCSDSELWPTIARAVTS